MGVSIINIEAAVKQVKYIGGRGGIRTHGPLWIAYFRGKCFKPDSATLPFTLPFHVANERHDNCVKEIVRYEGVLPFATHHIVIKDINQCEYFTKDPHP